MIAPQLLRPGVVIVEVSSLKKPRIASVELNGSWDLRWQVVPAVGG